MSLTSKITLGASIAFTASVVTYVHVKQKLDREGMREGVVRDIQRQEMRKTQNIKMLQDQVEITKALKGQQEREQEQRRQVSASNV